MPLFYLRAYTVFVALRVVSVCLHYLGPSPWGGPLVLSPDRFLPEALVIELGIWGFLCGLGALGERPLSAALFRRSYRAAFLVVCGSCAIFSQIDFEVVRWLGQHMSASYITNFAGARDGQLFARILKGDRLFSSLAAAQMVAAVAAAALLWIKYRDLGGHLRGRWLLAFTLSIPLALASPIWLRPSEKRWRRVEPASIGIAREMWERAIGSGRPESPARAMQDLTDLVHAGRYDAGAKATDPKYPLFRDDNVGRLSASAFRALPQEEKPDVIVLVFETMRGFNTGFLGPPEGPLAAMPQLNGIIRESALYFPRMHSAGYPSVAGAMGMHLGVWPHHSRIVFSSYLHVGTRSFPEMLREAGYHSLALLGADPSFSNFTPWFRRWYETVEYRKENHHDGPLVDRFIELYDQKIDAEQPLLMTLWTATTHPPYDVPKETGIEPADTNEERYLQAMRYADGHLARLVRHLKDSPRWDRTLVFVLGDHSQPTPWQWTHGELVGELNPGHTWTALAILGGKDVAPAPGRDDRVTSHVDLGPTILAAIDLRAKNHFFGRNLVGTQDERPVWAFRYGAITRESGDQRTIFRIEEDSAHAYRFDRDDLLSYGSLEGGSRTDLATDQKALARHRDVARAWAQLLDEDRVAPPLE